MFLLGYWKTTSSYDLTAAIPVAVTGVDVAAIILAASLGIGFVLAIFKEYEVIEFDATELKMKLVRRKAEKV